LIHALGLRRAASVLEAEPAALKGPRPAYAPIVDRLLEPSGIVNCDSFNQSAKAMQDDHRIPTLWQDELREFLLEGDPLLAWVGTPSMMIGALAVAEWEEHPSASRHECAQAVFAAALSLDFDPDLILREARTLFPVEYLDPPYRAALTDRTIKTSVKRTGKRVGITKTLT